MAKVLQAINANNAMMEEKMKQMAEQIADSRAATAALAAAVRTTGAQVGVLAGNMQVLHQNTSQVDGRLQAIMTAANIPAQVPEGSRRRPDNAPQATKKRRFE